MVRLTKLARHCFFEATTQESIQLIKNLPAFISLAVVLTASFTSSTQSAEAKISDAKTVDAKTADLKTAGAKPFEAKTSRHDSGRARDYFVPPPPPYTPSIIPAAMGMMSAEVVTADGDETGPFRKKPINLYSKYILTRKQGDMAQLGQPNPYLNGYDRSAELKVQKNIDSIDSEISGFQKDIGKLLNL